MYRFPDTGVERKFTKMKKPGNENIKKR